MQDKYRDTSIIKARILKYLDFKGISKYECYQSTGIANGVFSQRGGISEENILKFLSHYQDINPTWLLTGIGNILTKAHPSAISQVIDEQTEAVAPRQDNVFIPVVDLLTEPNPRQTNADNFSIRTTLQLPKSLFPNTGIRYCVPIKKAVMPAGIQNGDYVVIKDLPRPEWMNLKSQQIYMIVLNNGSICMERIRNKPDKEFIVIHKEYVGIDEKRSVAFRFDEIDSIYSLEWRFSSKMEDICETYYGRLDKLEDDVEILKASINRREFKE